MSFDGTEGGLIPLADAAAMTAAYRADNSRGLKGYFFGKDILKQILDQSKGCMGIRIYYAEDPDTGKQQMVIVGADAQENDMLDLVADFARPCPSMCGKPNVLNS